MCVFIIIRLRTNSKTNIIKLKNSKKMKKLFIMIIAVLFSTAVVDANGVSSNSDNTANAEIAVPSYWNGWAKGGDGTSIYIDVYRSDNMCDSFYAVATKIRSASGSTSINVELVVRKGGYQGYYVTYNNIKYTFEM